MSGDKTSEIDTRLTVRCDHEGDWVIDCKGVSFGTFMSRIDAEVFARHLSDHLIADGYYEDEDA